MTSSKDFVGPPAWTVLHSYAAAYTPEQRKKFISFVKMLGDLFPCPTCRDNFKARGSPLRALLGEQQRSIFLDLLYPRDGERSDHRDRPFQPENFAPLRPG